MAASASIEMLRVWVHATNRGTRQLLSAWWPSSEAPPQAGEKDSAPPTPVMIAAICAPDTDDQPLEHHYTCYDSDDGRSDGGNDADAHLELLKLLDARHQAPPASGSTSRAAYATHSSHKSGSAA